jgi:RNA polymerase sigma factor (sigma-70 family)
MSTADASNPPIETLYNDHNSWLRNWLRAKLGNAWDAADLAHDTYVRILHAGTRPAAEDARRYLTQVAGGLMIDLFRRRSIERTYLDELAQLPELLVPSEETRALALEALVELDRMLNRLPPKARRALLLCKLDGLSYSQIGQELGVSVSSVEKYMAAALQACYLSLYDTNP